MAEQTYSAEFGGKTLTVKLGKLAQQAGGSVVVQYGETTVLATAVLGRASDRDYFPLMVDYEEKYYAAGKIKGSNWIKREGRPSDEAVLTRRVIDRSIRPRFDQNSRTEVQCVATVLSFDKENDPDMPALFAVSTALMISNVPYNGPVSSVRVGRKDGAFILNPTYKEREESDLDIIVSGTTDRINMIEAGANVVSEDIMGQAIEEGFKSLAPLNKLQKEIAEKHGIEKTDVAVSKPDDELVKQVREFVEPKLDVALYTKTKKEHYAGQAAAKEELLGHIQTVYANTPELETHMTHVDSLFEDSVNRVVHRNVLENDKRVDGRKMDELRALSAEVGTIPHTHGNGLFLRGETQALTMLTLGAPGLEQWVESMEIDLTKKGFMHHYNFPPYSVGETGRIGFTGGRELGHGMLAERALVPIVPKRDDFPYTIRLVSEILMSNGSSSMASVCGATLALMDGGVPIKAPAAGIAMGIIMDESGENYKILTDIQGPEDHHGDMDLKVAGTAEGVTAMQMDVKIDGITSKIVNETLVQAKKARLEILETITAVLAGPRDELSPHAPRVHLMKIDPDKIGAVIGSGGKVINGIIEETGASIDIEDDGSVFITCPTEEGMHMAIKRIEQLTYEPKPGDEFDGEVVKLMDFGAFVQIAPGMDGMVHVSQMATERVERPSDKLKVGQRVHVWVREIDDRGRINLTMLEPGTQKQGPSRNSR